MIVKDLSLHTITTGQRDGDQDPEDWPNFNRQKYTSIFLGILKNSSIFVLHSINYKRCYNEKKSNSIEWGSYSF